MNDSEVLDDFGGFDDDIKQNNKKSNKKQTDNFSMDFEEDFDGKTEKKSNQKTNKNEEDDFGSVNFSSPDKEKINFSEHTKKRNQNDSKSELEMEIVHKSIDRVQDSFEEDFEEEIDNKSFVQNEKRLSFEEKNKKPLYFEPKSEKKTHRKPNANDLDSDHKSDNKIRNKRNYKKRGLKPKKLKFDYLNIKNIKVISEENKRLFNELKNVNGRLTKMIDRKGYENILKQIKDSKTDFKNRPIEIKLKTYAKEIENNK